MHRRLLIIDDCNKLQNGSCLSLFILCTLSMSSGEITALLVLAIFSNVLRASLYLPLQRSHRGDSGKKLFTENGDERFK